MHDPSRVARELGGKLSARTRHVCVLVGAGGARAAGLPDLAGLEERVIQNLDPADAEVTRSLFEQGNLETALSYLRRLASILQHGEELRGLTRERADELQHRIIGAIIPALGIDSADIEPFRQLAGWAAGGLYRLPVEIFTINYDLLFETGLESVGAPYFDGFVGNIRARFRPELVDDMESNGPESLPSNFVRLWKLHGSVNWAEEDAGESTRIVRLGVPVTPGVPAAIYPSDEKYDQSRRVPFVVLMDRFRRALAMPETVTLVSGYAFGDQHLNELLFDAARRYPRSEIVALCYADIPTLLRERAITIPNISVLAGSRAIIGGVEAEWVSDHELQNIWEDGSFQLGDFSALARFIATRARNIDQDD